MTVLIVLKVVAWARSLRYIYSFISPNHGITINKRKQKKKKKEDKNNMDVIDYCLPIFNMSQEWITTPNSIAELSVYIK